MMGRTLSSGALVFMMARPPVQSATACSDCCRSIRNARFAEDLRPPDPGCACYTCRTFSRAYLRHLYMAGEMTAATLNSLHNLHFYLDTMRRIREAIVFGTFEQLRQEFHQTFSRRPQQ